MGSKFLEILIGLFFCIYGFFSIKSGAKGGKKSFWFTTTGSLKSSEKSNNFKNIFWGIISILLGFILVIYLLFVGTN
jgi:hypothetical protein